MGGGWLKFLDFPPPSVHKLSHFIYALYIKT